MESPHRRESFTERWLWWLPFGRVPEVAPAALIQRLEQPRNRPQLLDVRTRREWNNGHIAGSLNIPMTALRSSLDSLEFDREKPVVTICLSAHRSIPAVRLLRRHGFHDVVQLAGGMLAWRRGRYPVR